MVTDTCTAEKKTAKIANKIDESAPKTISHHTDTANKRCYSHCHNKHYITQQIQFGRFARNTNPQDRERITTLLNLSR